MRASRTWAVIGSAALLLALASCGDDEPSGSVDLDDKKSSSSAPTESASTATGEPADAPGGDGLVFADIPATTGKSGPAVRAYLDYYEAAWASITTNKIPDGLRLVTTPGARASIEKRVTDQRGKKSHMSGEVTVSFAVADATERAVLLTGCLDESKLTKVVGKAAAQPVEGVDTDPTQEIKVEVVPAGDSWVVSNESFEVKACQ